MNDSTHTTLKVGAATVTVGVVAALGVGLAVGQGPPKVPSEPAFVSTAPPPTANNGNVGGEAPVRPKVDTAAVLKRLAPDFAILRRSHAPDDPPDVEARRATAVNGTPVRISVAQQGLCVHATGATSCGDPAAATTRPVIIHLAGPTDEVVSGVVPDSVQSVQIQGTEGGPVSVIAASNVYSVRVPGRTTTLTWTLKNGDKVRQLP